MKVIFIHPNFPAQFRHLAEFLAKDPANEVLFITANPRPEWQIPGVKKIIFKEEPDSPYAAGAYFRVLYNRGEKVASELIRLRQNRYTPDLIIGHSGWGTTLFVKDVYPQVPFLGYFEWFYDARSPNTTFFGPPSMGVKMELREKSLTILSDLTACDHGLCPTHWQLSQFPAVFRHKLSVIHDGINTGFFKPSPGRDISIDTLDLSQAKEIVTYTTRGFEPYRGFPQFIESLPLILENRPQTHVVIVGQDRVCYGPKLPEGQTYKKRMTEKVALPQDRVHFLDPLPYGKYLKILQASTLHVYLTVPFVLSWSLLEALSCGCLVVASDTPPVKEVIQDGINGVLTPFSDPKKLAEKVRACLDYPSFMSQLKKNARQTVLDKYDLNDTRQQQLTLINRLIQDLKEKKTKGKKPRFG